MGGILKRSHGEYYTAMPRRRCCCCLPTKTGKECETLLECRFKSDEIYDSNLQIYGYGKLLLTKPQPQRGMENYYFLRTRLLLLLLNWVSD